MKFEYTLPNGAVAKIDFDPAELTVTVPSSSPTTPGEFPADAALYVVGALGAHGEIADLGGNLGVGAQFRLDLPVLNLKRGHALLNTD